MLVSILLGFNISNFCWIFEGSGSFPIALWLVFVSHSTPGRSKPRNHTYRFCFWPPYFLWLVCFISKLAHSTPGLSTHSLYLLPPYFLWLVCLEVRPRLGLEGTAPQMKSPFGVEHDGSGKSASGASEPRSLTEGGSFRSGSRCLLSFWYFCRSWLNPSPV